MTDPANIPQPDQVACKLASALSGRNSRLAEQIRTIPRLPEMLWFIEWRRRQPGGLGSFAQELVDLAGEQIFSSDFSSLPVDQSGRFGAEDVFKVLSRLPAWLRPSPPADLAEAVEFALAAGVVDSATATEAGMAPKATEDLRAWLTKPLCLQECAAKCADRLQRLLVDFFFDDVPFPKSLAAASAWEDKGHQLRRSAELAKRLAQAIEAHNPQLFQPDQAPHQPERFPVMDDLPALVLRFMDEHAAKQLGSVACTEVTTQVWEAIRFAAESRSLVLVTGHSRYGKTESTRAMCQARPGMARLVSTPSVNGEREFLLRVAEALGYDLAREIPLPKLREKVCLALRHGKLTLIFDESSFLVPANYNRTTAPGRLNFVRMEIVDAGLGCVLIATPQAHHDSMRKFIEKTRYAMEQWLGRIDAVYQLPERLSLTDMLKVVQVRLPGISEQNAKVIVGRAAQTDQCLHAVTAILKRARWLAAQERGAQAAITPAEINRAGDEFVKGVCGEILDAAAPRPRRTGITKAPVVETRLAPAGRMPEPASRMLITNDAVLS